MVSAKEALEALITGNQRYAAKQSSVTVNQEQREKLVNGQAPFAIILGCADSRAPVELIFNQSVGDLFVVRVAGNIAEPSQIGSIEYATANLGTRLVVVLGHTHCGAVSATLSQVQQGGDLGSPHLHSIVEHIRPSVEPLLNTEPPLGSQELLTEAVRANIRFAAKNLREDSPILKNLILNDGLLVVGAEYSLETGVVDFFDGIPQESYPHSAC